MISRRFNQSPARRARTTSIRSFKDSATHPKFVSPDLSQFKAVVFVLLALLLAAPRMIFAEGSKAPGVRERLLRLQLVSLLLLLLSFGVTFRLVSLQQIQYPKWLKLADAQHDRSLPVEGARGQIIDREGRVLATSVEAFSVGVHPQKLQHTAELVTKISEILKVDEKQISARVESTKPYELLARGVTPETRDELVKLNQLAFTSDDDFRRLYPQGDLAAQVIGRVGRDGKGQSGIEREYDSRLGAGRRELVVKRDARGRRVMVPSENVSWRELLWQTSFLNSDAFALSSVDRASMLDEAPRDEGDVVQLSIDAVLQGIVEEEIQRALVETRAKRVSAVVMDAESGEVLAIGQGPRFNPNLLEQLGPDELRTVGTQDSFEPGSTFKPVVVGLALQAGVTNIEEKMDCEMGGLRVGKHRIRDVHPVGIASVRDVLVRSSNVCSAKLGMRLGKYRLGEGLKQFGFGAPTGIELPGEAKGILSSSENWKDIHVATISFGQGVSVTQLQLVRAYAAIANGGRLVTPTILKHRDKQEVSIDDARSRLFSEQVSADLRSALFGVTTEEHGTGRGAAIAGVKVYGKTGTAQKARVGARGYDPSRIFSSFIGFVDAAEVGVNRKLVMFVGVDEPQTAIRYGGVLAAPVFKRSIERMLSQLMTKQA